MKKKKNKSNLILFLKRRLARQDFFMYLYFFPHTSKLIIWKKIGLYNLQSTINVCFILKKRERKKKSLKWIKNLDFNKNSIKTYPSLKGICIGITTSAKYDYCFFLIGISDFVMMFKLNNISIQSCISYLERN